MRVWDSYCNGRLDAKWLGSSDGGRVGVLEEKRHEVALSGLSRRSRGLCTSEEQHWTGEQTSLVTGRQWCLDLVVSRLVFSVEECGGNNFSFPFF